MIPEYTIRIIFSLLFFTVLSFGFYHRLKAHRQNDRFERMKNEGQTTFLILRICGGLIWLNALFFPIVPEQFAPIRFESTLYSQIIGIVLAVVSVPMGISVFTNIGRNITDTVETRKDHQLVTTGIYQYIRHPLYTTGLFFFTGLGLISSNWLILVLSAVVAATLYVRTFTEEQKLIEEFGDQYRTYMMNTGKFIPKI